VVVIGVSLHYNVSLSPDRVIILLVLAGLATGRARLFFKDWSIFLIVLLAWQGLTGLTRNIGHFKPHVTEMIDADKLLFFGNVPTIWLQHRLFHPNHIAWYDIAATVLYLLHFVFPMMVAFALWYWKRPVFLEFMVAFLILALAGFATNILFPAAPPWMAANWWHRLPHVYRIFHYGVNYFGGNGNYSAFYVWIWTHIGWDPVAAVPSEHAAFPFLCFLYLRHAWKRAGWLALPYCAAVWFSIVYLGEHYVFDAIAGGAYAAIVYAAVRYYQSRHVARDQLTVNAAAA
jgi:hypothetical protein